MFSPYKVFFTRALSPHPAISGKGYSGLGLQQPVPLPVNASLRDRVAGGKMCLKLLFEEKCAGNLAVYSGA